VEINWDKVLSLLFLIPYWALLIGLLGFGLYQASRREYWRVKFFPRFYWNVLWPARFGRFLQFVGGLTLFIAVIWLFARSMAYLEGQPFWP